METQYDLVILGAGTAAMVAAMRVRAAGWTVAVTDFRPYGGTCALRGCDPKKMLISGTSAIDHVHRMHDNGVAGDVHIDWQKLMTFKRSFTDPVPETGLDVGKLVLSPTRTYAPLVKAILANHRPHIHGMVHCSGGAQTKVLHFTEKVHIIKDNLFPVPPLFRVIQEQSHTDWKEMYKVFNMGHRLEVYLPEAYAQDLIAISKSFGVEAQVIGHVKKSKSNELTIRSSHGEFYYEG